MQPLHGGQRDASRTRSVLLFSELRTEEKRRREVDGRTGGESATRDISLALYKLHVQLDYLFLT